MFDLPSPAVATQGSPVLCFSFPAGAVWGDEFDNRIRRDRGSSGNAVFGCHNSVVGSDAFLREGRMRAAIALVLLVLLPSVARAEARIALLIGNQGYNAKVGPLKNPHSDIVLVGAALGSLGFKVTEVKDADYRSIDAAIKRHIGMVRREGQGAISFVYYSGHGAADPDTKINYLIPVDVATADDEELWNYSINLNTLVENLRAQAPGATHYVVFDACRNELNLTRRGQKALTEKGFVPMAYTPGVMVAYATAPGRTASDSGSGGGTYAKALADEILKPGVDSMLVFTRVARRVQHEIGQDPFLSASTMPEVYFAGNSASAPAPGAQADRSELERAWAFIKETEDQARLEAFIRQFGDSAYAPMARARLEELKKKQTALTTAAPVGTVLGPTTESADKIAWDRVVRDGKHPDQLRRFITEFPTSSHRREAMFSLGYAYQKGERGLAIDYAQARRWYRIAADLGSMGATINLANLYAAGAGGPKDTSEARRLYVKVLESPTANAVAKEKANSGLARLRK
jgi:Caspase domain/Sel1 repeat